MDKTPDKIAALYSAHVDSVVARMTEALDQARSVGRSFEGVVVQAGPQVYYHADDMPMPFKPVPFFAWFVPMEGPDHLLHFRPGRTPRLIRVVPQDYWHSLPAEPQHPYPDVLDVVTVGTPEEAQAAVGDVAQCAFLGSDASTATALGIDASAIEPKELMAGLDWRRGAKTPYEIECVREAARIAGLGHAAVRSGVDSGQSERKLHAAYLDATGMLENEAPYSNIIAWDEGAAVLHYTNRRSENPDPGHVLLIDAGAVCLGYASDITRTYARDGVHPVFVEALDRVDAMQLELVADLAPGVEYVDLHDRAHRGIAAILSDLGIAKTSAEEAYDRGLTLPFLPHGLGHHLGIQVHDVGGHQANAQGKRQPPPDRYPFLRTTRRLEENHIVTIEPGLYFIPMLLDPLRNGDNGAALDWNLIDALIPCGGIRVEDDVLVTAKGHENLSRPFTPGHR